MNLRHLEILEAVARAGTFTGAAQKLFLTQSAVSHAVAELERQAGAPLFDRMPRGVRLTPCGTLLLEEARGILAACRELEGRLAGLEEEAPVKLVSSITIASFPLPEILLRVREILPRLQVQVRVVSAASAVEILQSGEADLALIEGAEPKGIFRSEPFGSYRLWAACAPGFPLRAAPLLLRERGSAIRDTLDSTLFLANQTARPLWESVNSTALIQAAQAGLGITVLPDLLLAEPVARKRLRVVALDGVDMRNEMLAVRNRNQRPSRGLRVLLDAVGGITA